MQAESTFILDLAASMKTRPLRTLEAFAEQEIRVPTGPYAGERVKFKRSPWARLLYRELDSGRWHRAFITGPNQDGKSLFGFIIPVMHTLFERRETCVVGVPNEAIVEDKWTLDLLPAIRASKYASFLPQSGPGSRGGKPMMIEFRGAGTLKFMTAGGDDQSRASFTASKLHVTETDGFDEVGRSSREGDKFSQLERRQLGFPIEQRMTVAECTVSTETGRTWSEYTNGTQSRILLPCPHCRAWVTPEREHVIGWRGAADKSEAYARTQVACPSCGEAWSDDERIAANARCKLAHKGQTINAAGEVVGDLPKTDTLGFRWTCINSVLNRDRLRSVGVKEWAAQHATDEEIADRDIRQSEFALPAKPQKEDASSLDIARIQSRTLGDYGQGVIPDDASLLTMGVDVGKYRLHWTIIAWRPNASPHVVDYGKTEVPFDTMEESAAITRALSILADELEKKVSRKDGKPVAFGFKLVDAGYLRDAVLTFTVPQIESSWMASVGIDPDQRHETRYKRTSGTTVLSRQDHYTLVETPQRQKMVEIEVNHWKSWLHRRIQMPHGQDGAFTLYASSSDRHIGFGKHLTAEKIVEKFVPETGLVRKWEKVSKNNHWLDSTVYALVAGHASGIMSGEAPRAVEPEPQPQSYYNPLTAYKGRW